MAEVPSIDEIEARFPDTREALSFHLDFRLPFDIH